MAELKEAEAPSWTKFVTDFPATKKVFDQNYAGLVANGSYIRSKHPELLPDYNKLVSKAQEHSAMLNKLAGIRSTVLSWLNSIRSFLPDFGAPASGFDQGSAGGGGGGGGGGVWGLDDQEGLGFVFTVPAAISVGVALSALAAITYWVKDAFVFSRRLNELQRLEGTGMTPGQAADVVNRTVGKPGSTSFFGIPQWILIGGIVLILGPAFFRFMQAAKER